MSPRCTHSVRETLGFPRVSRDEPRQWASIQSEISFPRVSGDQPIDSQRPDRVPEFSPRERG